MGSMADHYREQQIGDSAWPDPESFEEPLIVTRDSMWKTRAGHEVAVKDLKDEHLSNILKMHSEGRLRMPIEWSIILMEEATLRKL